MTDLKEILQKRNNIKKGSYVYYKLENEEHVNCVQVIEPEDTNLDIVSWIHHERIETKWVSAQEVNVLDEEVGPAPLEDGYIYINLHPENGIQKITVRENLDLFQEIREEYAKVKKLASSIKSGHQYLMDVTEAERRMEKECNADYAINGELLDRQPNVNDNLQINLPLALIEKRIMGSLELRTLQFYGALCNNQAFAKDNFKRQECFDYDGRIQELITFRRDYASPTLGRLLSISHRNLYQTYTWLMEMVRLDKLRADANLEHQLICLTAAQYCIQNMQSIANEFKIKIIVNGQFVKAIMPSQMEVEYTFVFGPEAVPLIHKGNREPQIQVGEPASILSEYCDIYDTTVEQLEENLTKAIMAYRPDEAEQSEENEVFLNSVQDNISQRIGTSAKRRTKRFSIREEFPIYCDSVNKETGRTKGLEDSESYKFLKLLTGNKKGQIGDVSSFVFDVSRDGAARSTMLKQTNDSDVSKKFPPRNRSSSRSREPAKILSSTKITESSPSVHFTIQDATIPKPAESKISQETCTVTNIQEHELPSISNLHRSCADFTKEEDKEMGVTLEESELSKLQKRIKWMEGNALTNKDHLIISKVKEISRTVEVTRTLYPQTPKTLRDMDAARIKSFAKQLKEMDSHSKTYARCIANTDEMLVMNASTNEITDIAWKLGQHAMQTAENETKRLTELHKVCNDTMTDRCIVGESKDPDLKKLETAAGVFTGKSLSSNDDAKSFQHWKQCLESQLEYLHVDKRDWGHYAGYLLQGPARDTKDREFPGNSNPNYQQLMKILRKNHGRPGDVYREVKQKQLSLPNIQPGSPAGVKQEASQQHRKCLEELRNILGEGSDYAGMIKDHLRAVSAKFPYIHRVSIYKMCNDDTIDALSIIDAIHEICDYLCQEGKDEATEERMTTMGQNYATSVMQPSGQSSYAAGKRSGGLYVSPFSVVNYTGAECISCASAEKLGLGDKSNQTDHLVGSKTRTLILESCPQLRHLNHEARARRVNLFKICKVCGKEYLSNDHKEDTCSFSMPGISCNANDCRLLASCCSLHKDKNLKIYESRKRKFQVHNISYNFGCQAVLNEEDESSLSSQSFQMMNPPRYTHATTKGMINDLDPDAIVSDKAGEPVFPMGLLTGLDGKVHPYVYDSGSSDSSILQGHDGKTFLTAPVELGEPTKGMVVGVGGMITTHIVNILLPLTDGSWEKMRVHVVPNTLQCQTTNIADFAKDLTATAKLAGIMASDEEIQQPEYGRRAVLMIGKSHEHLAPRSIYTNPNGLVLYESRIAGPLTSNGRSLCFGGSYRKGAAKETLAHLWATIPNIQWDRPAIITGSEARKGEMGSLQQNIEDTMEPEAMEQIAKYPDMINSIVHGENRVLGAASEGMRNVSSIIQDCDSYSLTGGEMHNAQLLQRRNQIKEVQVFVSQQRMNERPSALVDDMEVTDEIVTTGDLGAKAVSSNVLKETAADLQIDTGVISSTSVEIVTGSGTEVELAREESGKVGQQLDTIESLSEIFTEMSIECPTNRETKDSKESMC